MIPRRKYEFPFLPFFVHSSVISLASSWNRSPPALPLRVPRHSEKVGAFNGMNETCSLASRSLLKLLISRVPLGQIEFLCTGNVGKITQKTALNWYSVEECLLPPTRPWLEGLCNMSNRRLRVENSAEPSDLLAIFDLASRLCGWTEMNLYRLSVTRGGGGGVDGGDERVRATERMIEWNRLSRK